IRNERPNIGVRLQNQRYALDGSGVSAFAALCETLLDQLLRLGQQGNSLTGGALAAEIILEPLAVGGLREHPRQRELADAARSGDPPRVRNALGAQRPAQRGHNSFVAEKVREAHLVMRHFVSNRASSAFAARARRPPALRVLFLALRESPRVWHRSTQSSPTGHSRIKDHTCPRHLANDAGWPPRGRAWRWCSCGPLFVPRVSALRWATRAGTKSGPRAANHKCYIPSARSICGSPRASQDRRGRSDARGWSQCSGRRGRFCLRLRPLRSEAWPRSGRPRTAMP